MSELELGQEDSPCGWPVRKELSARFTSRRAEVRRREPPPGGGVFYMAEGPPDRSGLAGRSLETLGPRGEATAGAPPGCKDQGSGKTSGLKSSTTLASQSQKSGRHKGKWDVDSEESETGTRVSWAQSRGRVDQQLDYTQRDYKTTRGRAEEEWQERIAAVEQKYGINSGHHRGSKEGKEAPLSQPSGRVEQQLDHDQQGYWTRSWKRSGRFGFWMEQRTFVVSGHQGGPKEGTVVSMGQSRYCSPLEYSQREYRTRTGTNGRKWLWENETKASAVTSSLSNGWSSSLGMPDKQGLALSRELELEKLKRDQEDQEREGWAAFERQVAVWQEKEDARCLLLGVAPTDQRVAFFKWHAEEERKEEEERVRAQRWAAFGRYIAAKQKKEEEEYSSDGPPMIQDSDDSYDSDDSDSDSSTGSRSRSSSEESSEREESSEVGGAESEAERYEGDESSASWRDRASDDELESSGGELEASGELSDSSYSSGCELGSSSGQESRDEDEGRAQSTLADKARLWRGAYGSATETYLLREEEEVREDRRREREDRRKREVIEKRKEREEREREERREEFERKERERRGRRRKEREEERERERRKRRERRERFEMAELERAEQLRRDRNARRGAGGETVTTDL